MDVKNMDVKKNNAEKKCFITLLCLLVLVLSSNANALNCPTQKEFLKALRYAAWDFLEDPTKSKTPVYEVKDLIIFYLKVNNWFEADCNVPGDYVINRDIAKIYEDIKDRYGLVCNAGSDCGVSDYAGDNFCKDGDVYKAYDQYTCLNPKKVDSYCAYENISKLIENCEVGKECVEKLSRCQGASVVNAEIKIRTSADWYSNGQQVILAKGTLDMISSSFIGNVVEDVDAMINDDLGKVVEEYKGYIIKLKLKTPVELKEELEKETEEKDRELQAANPLYKYTVGFADRASISYKKVTKNYKIKAQMDKIEDEHKEVKKRIAIKLNKEIISNKLTGNAIGSVDVNTLNMMGEFYQVFNGIALDISDEEAEILSKLDEIEKVYPNKRVEALLSDSVPLIKANEVWRLDEDGNDCSVSGKDCLTGKDVAIAIIDTGVDFMHPDFGECLVKNLCPDGTCSGDENIETCIEDCSADVNQTMQKEALAKQQKKAELSELQKTACISAEQGGTCGETLEGLGIVTNKQCCEELEKCCEFEVEQIGPEAEPVINITAYQPSCGDSICHVEELKTCFDDCKGCEKIAGGWDFVYDDPSPMDDNGHGTHCASIAAGNGTLKGVAPDAKIYAYKVLTSKGDGYEDDIIAAIEMATTSDYVDVISMSLGGPGNPDDPMSTAVDNAVNSGVTVAVAAGNSGPASQTVSSPGTARKAITVGAVDKSKIVADFSSRGPVEIDGEIVYKPDIVAPGVNICAARWANAYSKTCNNDNKHVELSGTSMATPHVAGAAALLKQAHPDWTPEDIKEVLKVSAEPLIVYDVNTVGAGLLNTREAFNVQAPLLKIEYSIEEQEGNKTVEPKGTTNLRFTLTALLGDIENLEVTLEPLDDCVHITNPYQSVGPITEDNTKNVVFVLETDCEASQNLTFNLNYNFDSKTGIKTFGLLTNPCGDGVCDGGESPSTCLTDCSSYIYNEESVALEGFLTLKVQRDVNGKWMDVKTVVNNLPETIAPDSYLDLNGVWAQSRGYTTDTTGTLRVYGELKDAQGNVIYTEEGPLNSYSQFTVYKSCNRITTHPSTQALSAVYGDIIVWQDDRNGNWDIYMYNLSSGEETQITTEPANQFRPDIYKDIIVWIDARYSEPENQSFDLYIYNLSTGQETQITTTNSWWEKRVRDFPAIYEDIVVVQDSFQGDPFPYNMNDDIYMYNLSSGVKTQISTPDQDIETGWPFKPRQTWPAIHGDIVVWADYRPIPNDWLKNGNWDVYMYNLSSGEETQITIDVGCDPQKDPQKCKQQVYPDIYKDIIVWAYQEGLYPPHKIYIEMYNLSTGKTTQVSTDSSLIKSRTTIYGDIILWTVQRNYFDIDMYNRSSGIETQITTDPAAQMDPAIYEDIIAWEDYIWGKSDICVYNLSENLNNF